MREDLHQGSDHYSILSTYSFVLQLCIFELRPLWKKANKEAIQNKAKEIAAFPHYLSYISDIDSSIDFLHLWMKDVIAQHVTMSKPAPFRVPWWSEDIGVLVEEVRRAKRRYRRNLSELAK